MKRNNTKGIYLDTSNAIKKTVALSIINISAIKEYMKDNQINKISTAIRNLILIALKKLKYNV